MHSAHPTQSCHDPAKAFPAMMRELSVRDGVRLALLVRFRQGWSDPVWRDLRRFQILSLSVLLGYGLAVLGFDQAALNVAAIVAAALVTQWAMTQVYKLPAFDPMSPLITALSLSILLRANSAIVLSAAASMAIASKFLIRAGGKHVFNPANFGIVVLLLATDLAWISPAQWGSKAWAAFLFACLAGLVLSKAKRADVAVAFLCTYVALLVLRDVPAVVK